MALIHGNRSGIFFDGEISGPHGFLWGFVALEYYALVMNRVRLILITTDELIALNAGGPIAAPHYLSQAWYMPLSYPSERKMRRYERVVVFPTENIVRMCWANWKCNISGISDISFKNGSKWGMGSVPYSGRLTFLAQGRNCDLILVGNQNGREIEDCLKSGKMPNR
jgi:hypothetical protein